MRILGEINDLPFKVTALVMNSRISIKYEDGQHELTFKFRDGSSIQTMEDVDKYVHQESNIKAIHDLFHQMRIARTNAIKELLDEEGNKFPVII